MLLCFIVRNFSELTVKFEDQIQSNSEWMGVFTNKGKTPTPFVLLIHHRNIQNGLFFGEVQWPTLGLTTRFKVHFSSPFCFLLQKKEKFSCL
jgi:hypothetical protein